MGLLRFSRPLARKELATAMEAEPVAPVISPKLSGAIRPAMVREVVVLLCSLYTRLQRLNSWTSGVAACSGM